jgi:hypothetical protein
LNWQTLIENKIKPTVELTDTHRKQKQTNSGTDRHFRIPCNCNSKYPLSTVGLILFSMSVCQLHRWFVFVFYECLSVPPLVCFCFLWVSVSSTVGLFLFSMSVCRFHRWFVFVFYECQSIKIRGECWFCWYFLRIYSYSVFSIMAL